MERSALRGKLGLRSGKLIYIGAGAIASSNTVVNRILDILRAKVSWTEGASFLISSNVEIPSSNPGVRILRIPANDPESQNYIAACDLIISKAGYSTVSEAISGRVPMLLIGRAGVSEDESIIKAVESLGIARRVSERELMDEDVWSESLQSLLDGYKQAYGRLPDRYRANGNQEAACYIQNLFNVVLQDNGK